MLGWLRADAARASFSNRFKRAGSAETSPGRTLIATSRESRESLARQTSPIPPAPSGATISYGPRRDPGAGVISDGKNRRLPAGTASHQNEMRRAKRRSLGSERAVTLP